MAEQQGSMGADKPLVPRQKKSYVKPEVVSEPIYETSAMACGKLLGAGGDCKGAPHSS